MKTIIRGYWKKIVANLLVLMMVATCMPTHMREVQAANSEVEFSLSNVGVQDGEERYLLTVDVSGVTLSDFGTGWDNTALLDGVQKTGTDDSCGFAYVYKGEKTLYLILKYEYIEPGKKEASEVGQHQLVIPKGTVIPFGNVTMELSHDFSLLIHGTSVIETSAPATTHTHSSVTSTKKGDHGNFLRFAVEDDLEAQNLPLTVLEGGLYKNGELLAPDTYDIQKPWADAYHIGLDKGKLIFGVGDKLTMDVLVVSANDTTQSYPIKFEITFECVDSSAPNEVTSTWKWVAVAPDIKIPAPVVTHTYDAVTSTKKGDYGNFLRFAVEDAMKTQTTALVILDGGLYKNGKKLESDSYDIQRPWADAYHIGLDKGKLKFDVGDKLTMDALVVAADDTTYSYPVKFEITFECTGSSDPDLVTSTWIWKVIEETVLLDFKYANEDEISAMLGVTETEYSAPSFIITEEDTDSNKGVKVLWNYDGSKDIYQHVYRDGVWSKLFLAQAENYKYLRMWVANPGHTHIDINVSVETETSKTYMDLNEAKLVMKNGQLTTVEIGTDGIRIPKQFLGWVAIPIEASLLENATHASIEVSRTREAAAIEDYYVLDEIVVSNQIISNIKSTEDNTDYGVFDTSVKGSASLKNIIFMIGDGMGDGSLAAARLEREQLYLDSIERFGYIGTNNVADELTDSAAAGTALASGYKTTNATVGLTKDGIAVMNLSEWMKTFGKKIGIVSSSFLVDATPATFASHTSARGNHASIVKDMIMLNVDLLLGGGYGEFNSPIEQEDGSYIGGIEYAKTVGGYQYVTNKEEMEQADGDKVLGLFSQSVMNYASARPDTEPVLADMTSKALSFLDNEEEGFFVMIEGGNIDHANHANSGKDTISETIEFDDAVKIAKEYVDTHEDTLLIITADHETGGVYIENGEVKFNTTSHTTEPVPYYAYGTGTEYFANLTDNTQIAKAIMAATLSGQEKDSSTMLDASDLAESQIANPVQTETGVVYTANQQVETMTVDKENVKYAVVKYRNSVEGLCGKIDNIVFSYHHDGDWHWSEVITLNDGDIHTFTPIALQKYGNVFSVEVEGLSVEIAYVAFYDSYEAAVASKVNTMLKGEEPTGHACVENLTIIEEQQPDCTNDGHITYWICKCGKCYEDEECNKEISLEDTVVKATGHKEVTVPGVAPQIGKTGLTEGSKCIVCDELIKVQKKIPALKLAKPSATKITKATGGKKKITIKFKRVSQATKYEIQIATKKNMKNAKTIKVAGTKSKHVAKKLKTKTTYYIRIRTIKTVNGVTATSGWSKKVKVKTK